MKLLKELLEFTSIIYCNMKKFLLMLVMVAMATTDIFAQNTVQITTNETTVELNLEEIESIEFTNEPWDAWEMINTGTYNFSLYYTGSAEIEVFYREHFTDKTKAQFRLNLTSALNAVNDLIIDYDKETHQCSVGVQHIINNSQYGPVYVSDMPHYPLKPGMTYEAYPCTFNPTTGTFSLNLVYFVSTELGGNANGYFGSGVETIQLSGYKVYDYSFSMNYNGKYIDNAGNESAVISTTKGTDIQKYRVAVVKAETNSQEIANGMLDGTADFQERTEAGELMFPIKETGSYKAIAVTYDVNENYIETFETAFEYTLKNDDTWVSLGMATYTEDCLTTFFDVSNETYQVEVRQNKDNPGLYRMIHPYAAYGAATDKEYYIEIDATDSEGVYIPSAYGTGFDAGYGEISIASMAYHYMATQGASLKDVKDAGYCGILADNVITFPANALIISMAGYNNGAWYKSNINGAFKLDMSNMQPIEAAAAKAPAVRAVPTKKLKLDYKRAVPLNKKAKKAVQKAQIMKADKMDACVVIE